jgi:predicted AlkP superfamily phosphohydrolase/phosphomutase
MLERGALPNLKNIIDNGVRAPLKTLKPSLSVIVWTSIATGKTPMEHGIVGWDTTDSETGDRILANSTMRRVEALWSILSRAGYRVTVINWWATWPAEKVRGHIVSERYSRSVEGEFEGSTYPHDLALELRENQSEDWPWLRHSLEQGKLRSIGDDPSSSPSSPLTPAQWKSASFIYGHDYKGEQAAFHLLETKEDTNFMAFLSCKIDAASHYMWHFLPPGQRDQRSYSRVLEPVYAYEDDLLGRILDETRPGAHVIVVSDHGFERTGEGYDHQHSDPDGIFIGWGPRFLKGVELSEVSVYDIAPTVLHLVDLPVGRDLKGRVLEEALRGERPVQWTDSHETGRRTPQAGKSPVEDRIREQLRELGYVQ